MTFTNANYQVSLEIDHLPAGFYVIEAANAQGELYRTKLILK